MSYLRLELEVISPLFLNGASPGDRPELRAASVRGQLRYWMRAIIGAQSGGNLEKVREEEANLFGSTECGSMVTIRLQRSRVDDGQLQEKDIHKNIKVVPHSKTFTAPAILDRVPCILEILTRPGIPISRELEQTLSTWFLLGGLGKRSRRLFGAFDLLSAKPNDVNWWSKSEPINWWGQQFDETDDFASTIRKHMDWIFPQPISPMNIPDFPTLHKDHSWIVVGKKQYAEADLQYRIHKDLFDILRSTPYRDNDVFGYARKQGNTNIRLASPVIAQVRLFEDGFHLVMTAMRSNSSLISNNVPLDWRVLNSFMNDAITQFNGVTVWGGHFK